MRDWGKYSDRLPTKYEWPLWSLSDGGVGVVCGGPAGGYLTGVDVDTDDPAIQSVILSAVPPSPVKKAGRKGVTLFYQGPDIIESVSWDINKARVADLIGPGRQTVLPPSVHPDTGQPYQWVGADTLEDVAPGELPLLTPDHIAAVGEALRPLGWQPKPEQSPRGPMEGGAECDDSRGREYGLGLLAGCADDVAHAAEGTCNTTLRNKTSKVAGKAGCRGWITKEEAEEKMYAACLANGYISDDGETAFYATFNGRWAWGIAHPLPGPPERYPSNPERMIILKPKS